VVIKHNIVGFDVAMYDANTVCIVQRSRELPQDSCDFVHGRQWSAFKYGFAQPLSKRTAIQVSHGYIADISVRTVIIDRDNVAMFE